MKSHVKTTHSDRNISSGSISVKPMNPTTQWFNNQQETLQGKSDLGVNATSGLLPLRRGAFIIGTS